MADKSPGRGPAFKAGDTITNGTAYFIIQRVAKTSYELKGLNTYMPIAIVDRLWTLASNEGEIVE